MAERPKSVLAVFAHPDDETLLAGALIAAWVAAGRRVDLLCLAPGDDGDPGSRMSAAAKELGIASVSSLRFRTYLPGSPVETSGPPMLATSPERVIIDRICGKMTELAPDIVLTHSRYGDYGHPDHAFAHRAAMAAAAEAAPGAEVYALAWPQRIVRANAAIGRLFGGRSGPIPGFDFAEALRAAPPVTETVNVRRFLGVRKRAARHYAKEMARGPLPMRMLEAAPVWAQSLFLGKARLSRVR